MRQRPAEPPWRAPHPFLSPSYKSEISFYNGRNTDESDRLTVPARRPDVMSLHNSPLPVLPLEGEQEGRERFVESAG